MLNNRENAFEEEFILDEEQEFKAKAMASKLFGLWACEIMGIKKNNIDNYIKILINLAIRNKDHQLIIDKVKNDLSQAGLNYDNKKLNHIFIEQLEKCQANLSN